MGGLFAKIKAIKHTSAPGANTIVTVANMAMILAPTPLEMPEAQRKKRSLKNPEGQQIPSVSSPLITARYLPESRWGQLLATTPCGGEMGVQQHYIMSTTLDVQLQSDNRY